MFNRQGFLKVLQIILFKVLLFSFFSIFSNSIAYAAPPPDFQITPVINSGLEAPTSIQFAPDGRLFILERAGKVKIYKNGSLLTQHFVDLNSVASGDRGAIGMVFDPNYSSNKFVYFYYTSAIDLKNRIVRFDASLDVAQNSGTVIYITSYTSHGLHVGGGMVFGPDGKIYLGIGDNGDGPGSQDLSTQNGKILRLNKDGTIPNDNPYVGQPGKLPEIWAHGLRNPWRLKLDSVTGKIYTGDVGASAWEEVNEIVKGANYGWPICEGSCSNPAFKNPLYTYNHNGAGASVTLGLIYRGNMFPSTYNGRIFVTDFTVGFIRTLSLNQSGGLSAVHNFDTGVGTVVDMQQGVDGSIYYITAYPGRVYKIVYNQANQIPIASASSNKTGGSNPLTVNFSSSGSYDPDGDPLTFSWDFGDGTTSNNPNPVKVYNDKGVYTVQLTVNDGQNSTISSPIIIQVGIPPTVTIFSPNDGDLFKAGDVITCNVFGTDAANVDVSDSDITTEIFLHHNTHFHPFLGPIQGRVCDFIVPTVGETDHDIWYRITTTVTDSSGLTSSKTIYIYPIKTDYIITSQPTGLEITLEGSPVSTPVAIKGVVGFQREVDVQEFQTINGKEYKFTGWSNGQPKKHLYTITPNPQPLIAFFTELSPPSFTSTATAEGNITNQPINITSTITNAGGSASGVIVDVEVYNSSYEKIFQEFYINETFNPTEVKTYEVVFTPTTPGVYYVMIGVFGNYWTTLYNWNSYGYTLNVADFTEPEPEPEPTEPTFTSTSTADGNTTGQPIEITANIKNSGGSAEGVIVHVEVYSSEYEMVFQKYYVNQSFSANEEKIYEEIFTPLNSGVYYIMIGVFGDNWVKLYDWNSHGYTLNVVDSAEPEPEPEPTEPTFTSIVMVHGNTVNQLINITSTIMNSGSSAEGVIVHVEIYNSLFEMVSQKYYLDQRFQENEEKIYEDIFTPASPGVYYVMIGVFGDNWNKLYDWNSDGYYLVVGS